MSFVAKYDIRGIYPTDIDEKFAFRLGRAFVALFKSKKVIVGQDARESSQSLTNELIHGLVMQGADVVDMGLCSTPMLYHAAQEADAIMVTASHNPKEYNGFKLCRKGSVAVGEADGLTELVRLARAGSFQKPARRGKVTRRDLLPAYVSHVQRFANLKRKLRVVIDAGNGMAGLTVPAVFKRLLVEVVPLFFGLDGTFPNHAPNTDAVENFRALQAMVKKRKADVGFLFDGDCDRLAMVDERGRIVSGGGLAALLSSALVKKDDVVVATPTIPCPNVRQLSSLGAKLVLSRVGHTNVSHALKERRGVFAFERSGHYYFRDFHFADSADVAAVIALSAIARQGRPVSELVEPFEPAFDVEGHFHSDEPGRVIARLAKVAQGASVCELDGLRLDFKEGWVLVRPSNTEPVVKYYAQADSKKALDRMVRLVRKAAS